MSTILSLLAAILMLGILITLHELGHYIAGRLLGLPVIEFAVGFGPRLFGWERGGIQYSLRAFPLGGYCAFAGEDAPEELGQKSINDCAPWRRLVMQVSGPLMNLLAGFLLAVVLYSVVGLPVAGPPNIVQSVEVGMPAEAAGMLPGDAIIEVNGQATQEPVGLIAGRQGAVDLVVERDGERLPLSMVTAPDKNGEYRVGVTITNEITDYQPVSLGLSVQYSWEASYKSVGMMLNLLKDLVTGKGDVDSISGVVGAVSVITTQTAEGFSHSARAGFFQIISMAIMISYNLGVFNLLPVPALDGGRIVFTLIEMIFRRPIPRKVENVINGVGFVLLMGLMVLMVIKDVWGLATGGGPL